MRNHQWLEPDDLYWDDEFDDTENGLDNFDCGVNVRKVVVMGFWTGGATDAPDIEDDEYDYDYEDDPLTAWDWIAWIVDWWRRWWP